MCISLVDLYKLTAELLGEGSYAKVQGAVSLQNGKEYAVKVSKIPKVNFNCFNFFSSRNCDDVLLIRNPWRDKNYQ